MADPWVANVQRWLNDTYTNVPGWNAVDVDGYTGWETISALTRALQHELGITALSDSFGPSTMSALMALGSIGPSTSHPNVGNICAIVAGALYCKGYNGGNGALPTTYSEVLTISVRSIREDLGIDPGAGTVSPKLFKTLLSMDSYRLLGQGLRALRSAQQWLNRTYDAEAAFTYIPTDGVASRSVFKALVFAIQYEGGITADGSFGPATQANLKLNGLLTRGTSGKSNYKRIFRAAMLANRQAVSFSDSFDDDLERGVKDFQRFVALAPSGEANAETWLALLQSRGDPNRPARACDTSTPVTAGHAAALYGAGYRAVGRYLVTAGSDPTKKVLQPGELQTLFAAGLSVFPIFQLTSNTLSYFSESRGRRDGAAAATAAMQFGFPTGSTIYFCVDYDTQDAEIASHVIPYFGGVLQGIRRSTAPMYLVGVYGTRNVCTQVSNRFGLPHSFVSDMSTGYSGNLGFAMPRNWAFDQIQTVKVPSGNGSIEVDRDVWYGGGLTDQHPGAADLGCDATSGSEDPNAPFFAWLARVQQLAVTYSSQHDGSASPRELTLQYLRVADGRYRGTAWDTVARLDGDWVTYAGNQTASGSISPVRYVFDPLTGQLISADHLAYTMQGVLLHGSPAHPEPNLADISGWGGDLITILGSYLTDARGYASCRDYASAFIGASTEASDFSQDDLLADVDGHNLALALRAEPGLDVLRVFAEAYQSGGIGPSRTLRRFSDFFEARYGSSDAFALDGRRLFRGTEDPVLSAGRAYLLLPHLLGLVDDATIDACVAGFEAVIDRRRQLE